MKAVELLFYVSAIIGVQMFFASSHFRFTETIYSNYIVPTCNNYIDSTL